MPVSKHDESSGETVMRKISAAVLTAVFCLVLMAAGVSGNDAYSQKAREYGVRDYSIAFYDNGNLSYENFGNGVDENTVFELASNGKMIARSEEHTSELQSRI